MNTLTGLLNSLRELDIQLRLDKGRLRYSAPEGVMTADILDKLREHREELVNLLASDNSRSNTDDNIPSVSRTAEFFPISFAQQRLWFLAQMEGPNAVYNIPMAFRLVGPLHLDALRHALTALVERHEILRCRFTEKEGNPVTQLLPVYDPLDTVDLTALAQDEQQKRIQKETETYALEPFDLTAGRLLKFRLLQLRQQEHILLCSMHHIISDGWSFNVLLRDWQELYKAYLDDRKPELPVLQIQYLDYAVWQKKHLQGELLDKQLSWWRKQLDGAPQLLELPTDHPRPAVQSYHGARVYAALGPELSQKIQQLSRQQQSTLFMTMLTAFSILLHRWSGQDDILIGTPVAGRMQSQTEHLIGFFANTLILRARLPKHVSFIDLLKQVRDTAFGVYAHQDIPFEHLVEQLKPERSLSHNPLFQVLFLLHNDENGTFALPDIKMEPLDQEIPVAKFDLTLSVNEHAGQMFCCWEYATDLFEPSTVQRMADHFKVLLEGIVRNSEADIRSLPLLTKEEKRQFVKWNNTTAEYPENSTLTQLFEEQARKTPDSIALLFKEKQLTYRELNEKANQLAWHIQRCIPMHTEASGGLLIGVALERSPEMLIAVLAVMKAGAAYVPIDPGYPLERIRFLLHQAEISLLITADSLRAQLAAGNRKDAWTVLSLDTAELAGLPSENPGLHCAPDDLAYVIFTSGSTGQPKGVMISHRGAVNTVDDINNRFAVTQEDRILALSSLSFDLSVYDIFGMLISGGAVVIPDPVFDRDPAYWAEMMQQHQVTLWNSVPALMQLLADHLAAHSAMTPASLRLVMMSGDWIPLHLPDQIKALWPEAEVISLGGATEASIWSICHPVGQVDPAWKSIPYGRPLRNQTFHILNTLLEPCPVSIPGHLYIGGVGLALGYLKDEQRTAESFIVHPQTGERLYKTGDVGRYLPDGTIEFLGREDFQVKVRGFRIELGEIEAVLEHHPAVQECAVVVHGEQGAEQCLAAYCRAEADSLFDKKALRDFLRNKLPGYMIPSDFILLERLPLTSNGKIDRKHLSLRPLERASETSFTAPRTPEEKKMAGIWKEVLEVKQIGVYDSFFDVGGHSLNALQIVAKIADLFSVKLPLRDFFQYPTVAELAEKIQEIQNGADMNTEQAALDLHAEVVLAPEIQASGLPVADFAEPKAILLTGATGFLGVFLLSELLNRTEADIYCLIRASGPEDARQRLQRQLEHYELWNSILQHQERIIPLVGELSGACLGLEDAVFSDLSRKIDIIYHNGALVNFVYPYAQMKAANVQGTHEILKLASTNKLKPVHYISTISVFSPADFSAAKDRLLETRTPDGQLAGGYAQSKWVAEQLVLKARDRGLLTSIYRPALVSGHSRTGVLNTGDFLCREIKGMVQLGLLPPLGAMQENLVPVDYVSQAVVHISQQKNALCKNFHLLNPAWHYIVDIYRWLHSIGYPLTGVSYTEWRNSLIRSKENALQPLLPLFPEPTGEEPPAEKLVSTEAPFAKTEEGPLDAQNLLDGLAGTDIVCPHPRELIKRYYSYFVRSGFLEEPAREDSGVDTQKFKECNEHAA